MPRRPRAPADDCIYHAFNRAENGGALFKTARDFGEFVRILGEGRKRSGIRLLAYCLLPDRWHLILWPRKGRELSRFIAWVGTTHVRRHRQTSGGRKKNFRLYAGRFKAFIVQPGEPLATVRRYVESAPVRAKAAKRPETWGWSSLSKEAIELDAWPGKKPGRAKDAALPADALERLETSVARDRPFGDPAWTARIVARLGLQSTMRNPWRPAGSAKRKGK